MYGIRSLSLSLIAASGLSILAPSPISAVDIGGTVYMQPTIPFADFDDEITVPNCSLAVRPVAYRSGFYFGLMLDSIGERVAAGSSDDDGRFSFSGVEGFGTVEDCFLVGPSGSMQGGDLPSMLTGKEGPDSMHLIAEPVYQINDTDDIAASLGFMSVRLETAPGPYYAGDTIRSRLRFTCPGGDIAASFFAALRQTLRMNATSGDRQFYSYVPPIGGWTNGIPPELYDTLSLHPSRCRLAYLPPFVLPDSVHLFTISATVRFRMNGMENDDSAVVSSPRRVSSSSPIHTGFDVTRGMPIVRQIQGGISIIPNGTAIHAVTVFSLDGSRVMSINGAAATSGSLVIPAEQFPSGISVLRFDTDRGVRSCRVTLP